MRSRVPGDLLIVLVLPLTVMVLSVIAILVITRVPY